MFTKWTEHLKDPQEQEQFRNRLRAAKPILERLSEVLKQEQENTARSELNPKVYDIANWAYLQADMNGYKRAIAFIHKLIDLDQQDQKEKLK